MSEMSFNPETYYGLKKLVPVLEGLKESYRIPATATATAAESAGEFPKIKEDAEKNAEASKIAIERCDATLETVLKTIKDYEDLASVSGMSL